MRFQLNLMSLAFKSYKQMFITEGKIINSNEGKILFPDSKTQYCISNVTINDITYKPGMSIIADLDEVHPIFGNIENIMVIDEEIIFSYKPYIIIGFESLFYAYRVFKDINTTKTVNYKNLLHRHPCLTIQKDNSIFIATRYRV